MTVSWYLVSVLWCILVVPRLPYHGFYRSANIFLMSSISRRTRPVWYFELPAVSAMSRTFNRRCANTRSWTFVKLSTVVVIYRAIERGLIINQRRTTLAQTYIQSLSRKKKSERKVDKSKIDTNISFVKILTSEPFWNVYAEEGIVNYNKWWMINQLRLMRNERILAIQAFHNPYSSAQYSEKY